MNCCVISCERKAIRTYKLREIKFSYCKRHKYIPDIIIKKIKRGFYKGYARLLNMGNQNGKLAFS